jgi:nitrite reductase/ring-hydroxylating ferredoxin subunit
MNRSVTEKFLSDKFPDLDRGPVSVDIIRDPAIFEQEKEHIFRKGWLFAGRVEQILSHGDFFVRDVPTFDMSLIFVRGQDGQVRGFQNACRHRGNHVCLEAQGNCKYFTCSFHGWSYDTQGKLKGLTDDVSFFDICSTVIIGLRRCGEIRAINRNLFKVSDTNMRPVIQSQAVGREARRYQRA